MIPDLHPAAIRELSAAASRLESARRGYGNRFREAVRRSVRQVGETPQSFPPDEDAPDGFEVRYVHLSKYAYRIVFVVLNDAALVVAVAHDSREPGYWVERLPVPPPVAPSEPVT